MGRNTSLTRRRSVRTAVSSSSRPSSVTVAKNARKILAKRLRMAADGGDRPCIEVADAADTFDSLAAVLMGPDLLPQVVHVRVDASIERRQFAPEHFTGQQLAAHDASCR